MKGIQKKKLIIFAIILIIIALIAYFLAIKKPFRYAGTLEVTKVDISSRLAAAIDEVHFYEGDRINAGETAVTFVCEDFRVAAELAKENYDRYSKLIKPGFTTPENIDQLITSLKDANIKVDWCSLTSPLDATVLD